MYDPKTDRRFLFLPIILLACYLFFSSVIYADTLSYYRFLYSALISLRFT